ncbi:MAG: hypothetical protein HKO53_15395 [Gemmatimonadetes bacterium]|nr:hypothetical protein [Gemmatimonadota bacterium]
MTTTYTPGALKADAVLTYATSPKEGSRRGCTMTIVNDESGGRVTVRFRKPKGFKAVLVDVMVGSDNESDYAFAGTLRGTTLKLSAKAKAPTEKAKLAKAVVDWTFTRVASGAPLEGEKSDGTPFAVRCLHEGRCACCGRKLTTPESIDRGIGPVCAGKMAA